MYNLGLVVFVVLAGLFCRFMKRDYSEILYQANKKRDVKKKGEYVK